MNINHGRFEVVALLEMIRVECVGTRQTVKDKAEALRTVAALVKKHPAAAGVSEEAILRGLETREAMGSTGLVRGVALPHCRISGLNEFIAGLLTIEEGVRYGSLDGRKARLLIFVIAPEGREADHLQAMAALSGVLKVPDIVEQLMLESSAQGLYERFAQLWREQADTR